MSPEQILHPSEIDHRSDVYSAGIVLYEMLTGDVPFNGETEFAIQSQQVKDPVPDPTKKNAQITPKLKEIMLKSHFFKQLKAASKKRVDPFQLLINMMGLTIFPFIASPLFRTIGDIKPADYDKLMEERKKMIPRWINEMIKTS